MLEAGREYLNTAWWISVFPGLALMATILAVSLGGDWMRDVLNPNLRHEQSEGNSQRERSAHAHLTATLYGPHPGDGGPGRLPAGRAGPGLGPQDRREAGRHQTGDGCEANHGACRRAGSNA